MCRVVLVVDDDPQVLEITATMLEELGCDVITAQTPQEALAMIASDRRIEILITDINMPMMNGYELAAHAKRIRSGLDVILLSGRESDGRGFPIIRKPFLQADLKQTMRQATGLC
ncbi:MAG TPA: response regulator [Xanthobacteraceae bacterium]|jgi:CheY-like chemotaxis protein